MVDLSTSMDVGVEVPLDGNGRVSGMLKMRNGRAVEGSPTGRSNVTGSELYVGRVDDKESKGRDGRSGRVKHYDADGDFFFFFFGFLSFNSFSFVCLPSSYESHRVRGYSYLGFGGDSFDL